jgi:succinate dehydrogenase hydrophobic anchor subunit
LRAYTGTHRRPLSAARRNARADWLMSLLTGLVLAAVAGIGAYFAVRYGVGAFIHRG